MSEQLSRPNGEFGNGDYEIRVDGVAVARRPHVDEGLQAAVQRKDALPQQLVALHDLLFGRVWTVDIYGRVITA